MNSPRLLAVTGLLVLALSGCGAGLDAQTYQTRTVGDASNVDLGPLAVRNIAVNPPSGGFTHPAGSDVRGVFRVANRSDKPDTLLEITSDAAAEVVVLQDGAPAELAIPANGSTEGSAGFVLRDLAEDLVTGEYVKLTLRFERAGSLDVLVPVATTGRAGRPVLTGEPGSEEGEPALQGPAGGHSEKGAEEEPSEAEPSEGAPSEAEPSEVEPSAEPAPSGGAPSEGTPSAEPTPSG